MKFNFLKTNESEVKQITSLLTESVQNPSLNENFKSRLITSTNVGAAHPMYVIDLHSLKDPAPLKLSAAGKRYIISNDKDVIIGGAEITTGKDLNEHYSIHDNHYHADMDKALTAFEKGSGSDEEFEVSFIKVPALHIAALLLENKKKNYIISLDQIDQTLTKYDIYTESDFFAILRRLAKGFDETI